MIRHRPISALCALLGAARAAPPDREGPPATATTDTIVSSECLIGRRTKLPSPFVTRHSKNMRRNAAGAGNCNQTSLFRVR